MSKIEITILGICMGMVLIGITDEIFHWIGITDEIFHWIDFDYGSREIGDSYDVKIAKCVVSVVTEYNIDSVDNARMECAFKIKACQL